MDDREVAQTLLARGFSERAVTWLMERHRDTAELWATLIRERREGHPQVVDDVIESTDREAAEAERS